MNSSALQTPAHTATLSPDLYSLRLSYHNSSVTATSARLELVTDMVLLIIIKIAFSATPTEKKGIHLHYQTSPVCLLKGKQRESVTLCLSEI